MCDQKEPGLDLIHDENFQSSFAKNVAVNSYYKLSYSEDFSEKNSEENGNASTNTQLKVFENTLAHYKKISPSANMEEPRRIVSRRTCLTTTPQRYEIPLENLYSRTKIETLQWQVREMEKSNGMYKIVLKEIATFLGKTHVSLNHLGTRLNQKNSVQRSKSAHHIVSENESAPQDQRSLIEAHINSWNKPKECHPDEIPPDKLSQEAFRLQRTVESLLSTQEPNLVSSPDSLSASDAPSDIEFLAQLAKEFPSDSQKRLRTTSFSVSPKLILPENDHRISTAFNRKLSLQLSEVRRNPEKFRPRFGNNMGTTILTEVECHSMPPQIERFDGKADPLRTEKTPESSASASASSTEGESGFSSLNSYQDVGLPPVNSTGVEDVSARSVLLKSMLHTSSENNSLSNESDDGSLLDVTLTPSPRPSKIFVRKRDRCLSDLKLWQKPAPIQQVNGTPSASTPSRNPSIISPQDNSQGTHKMWHSTPEQKGGSQAVKVQWV